MSMNGHYTIAIEEHYWDKELSETFAAGAARVRRQDSVTTRLFQYGEERIKEMDRAGFEVAAVYLQPIEMEPPGMMRDAKESDVHLEADIKALKGNKNGYAEGDWVGYLKVTYELVKAGDSVGSRDLLLALAEEAVTA